ncbi:MAG: tetratricopeptide repeat protein [Deltaproteobacteria bacterium]|nr:tetratricopeptide repeat protein [Deltaproteobacteria bacterium]
MRQTSCFLIPLIVLVLLFSSTSFAARKKKHIPSDLAMSHNNQGVKYLAVNDLDKAEWEFKTASEMDPKFAEAWNNLGLVYKYKGDYPNALESLRKAAKADSKWASPHNHLGAVYLAMGNIPEAISSISKAIQKDKKYADAHYNLGLCYREYVHQGRNPDGFRKKAIASFKKATDIEPRLYHAHSDLGDVYREQGEWEKAIIRYRLAIETKPDDPEPWNKLGSLYMEKGDAERAQAAFAKATALGGQAKNVGVTTAASSEENRLKYGEALLQEGSLDQALQIFLKITGENPRNEKGWFDLGYTYTLRQNYPEARQAYLRAREINPDFIEAHFNLAMTDLALGDKQSAAANFRAALAVDAHHARSLYNLGILFHEAGDGREANRYLCLFTKDRPEEFPKELEIAKKVIKANGGCGGL